MERIEAPGAKREALHSGNHSQLTSIKQTGAAPRLAPVE